MSSLAEAMQQEVEAVKKAGAGDAAEGKAAMYLGVTGASTMSPAFAGAFGKSRPAMQQELESLKKAGAGDAAAGKVVMYLGFTGVATMSSAFAGAFAKSTTSMLPGGGEAYDLALLGFFLAGVAEVGAGVWASPGPTGRRAAAKAMLRPALVLLVAVAGLTTFALFN